MTVLGLVNCAKRSRHQNHSKFASIAVPAVAVITISTLLQAAWTLSLQAAWHGLQAAAGVQDAVPGRIRVERAVPTFGTTELLSSTARSSAAFDAGGRAGAAGKLEAWLYV